VTGIPFARPDITDAECDAVVAAMRSGWITTGPQARAFEAAFAERVGARHAVAVNSCTAALHLGLEALGVAPGDEVIVPAMTFASTAEVVHHLGARPVLVDCRREDHNLDLGAVERALGPRTRAIIPVHYGGQACEIEALLELARARGVAVVEDAAHAFPASAGGRPIGSHGDVVCFSFYATKTITTGEGGMAVTNREDLAGRMRMMALHGLSRDAWRRYSSEGHWYYEIEAPGFKYNMTDIAAAMGLVQLGRTDEMLDRRRAIARRYTEAFAPLVGLELLEARDFEAHAWHLYAVRQAAGRWSIDRDRLIEELRALGIGTSVHFIPLHIHPYYREAYGYRPEDCPTALDCYRRSISLPIYSAMADAEVDQVVDAVTALARRWAA